MLDWAEFDFVDGGSSMEHNALFVCREKLREREGK